MKQKLAAIISLIALTFIMALTSCAPISDNVGGNGTGGNGNNSQITIKLPPIASSAIRALTEEQVSRLQRETKKYRVTFNGVGQTITREGEGTTYSATFPVGTQVGVTVYCLNAKGEIIVRTVTKNITISSGANSLSFKLSDDGTEIIHESGGDTPGGDVPGGDTGGGSGDDEKPDDDDSGGDDNPPAPPPPVTEYVNITFNQGFVYTNTVHQSPSTWQAMTGATLPNSGQREKGSTVSADQATATGYVFKGWVENSQSPSGDAPDAHSFNYVQNYDSDMTLYAIWEQIEPGSHSVKFAGGTTTGSSASGLPQGFQQKEGTQATFSGTPTCPGYEFTGWIASSNVTDLSQGTSGSDWTFTMPTSDVTLTAQWNVITYTVSYEANDGQATPAQTETFTVDAGGANVTLKAANTFTRTGYTLSQWNAGNNNWSPSTDVAKTSLMALAVQGSDTTHYNVTLTAQWTINSYKVTYALDGGSGGPANGNVQYNANVSLDAPTKTGYNFMGWSYNGTTYGGTSGNNSLTMPAQAITLTAQWTPITYSIKLNTENSNWRGVSGVISGDATVPATYGTTATLPAITAPTGYTFAGWAKANGATSAASDITQSGGSYTATNLANTQAATVDLYPVWQIINYKIVYNGNSNTGGTAPTEATYTVTNNNVQLADVGSLVKTGYNFLGWNTTQGATSALTLTFAQLQQQATQDDANNYTLTLYAVWNVYYKTEKSKWAVGDIIIQRKDNNNIVAIHKDAYSARDSTTYGDGVAVVYKNDSNKVYIVGKTHSKSGLMWCLQTAKGYRINLATLQCAPDSGGSAGKYTWTQGQNTDGSGNWQKLRQELGSNDDTGTVGNYPAWEWANNYGTTQNLSGDLQTNWYLPSIAELFDIWKANRDNSGTIASALTVADGSTFSSDEYYSSSQNASDEYVTRLNFGSGGTTSSYKTYGYNSVCAVRAFTY